jgi:hypothetical protein
MGFFYGHALFAVVDVAALLYQAIHLRSIAANITVIVATTAMLLTLWCMASEKPGNTCGRWWSDRYRKPARWWAVIADILLAVAFVVAVWALTVKSDRIVDGISPVVLNAAAHLLHMYTYHDRLTITDNAWVSDMNVPLAEPVDTAVGEDDDEVVLSRTRSHRARGSPPLPPSKLISMATDPNPFTIGTVDEE